MKIEMTERLATVIAMSLILGVPALCFVIIYFLKWVFA